MTASPTVRVWLKPVLVALGIAVAALAIWFGGPLAGYGTIYPLESALVRLSIIAAMVAIALAIFTLIWLRRRRAEAALRAALSEKDGPEHDGNVLAERMEQALSVLKASSKAGGSYLYDLPWYIVIGPPGAGKTTALVNSGLKFPLANGGSAAAIAGTGGTRYCDWWFTEEAVLIDTAGRYTTQDSDTAGDAASWQAFLALLKKHRPRQPINGAIVAISLEDLMLQSPGELDAHAQAIRKRLLELHETLRVDFPVYSLFTKADLVAGFREYFASFTEARRRRVWGATFQTEDRRRRTVGEVPGEYDALVRRLTEELPDRLQEEPDPIARIAIFGLPAQMAGLRERVAQFLATIFEPTRFRADVALRGFYFSSGTQEGTPFDQALGAMGRSLGATPRLSGTGKSFFLHDLLKKVVFAEAGWVSRDMAAVRRQAAIHYGTLAAVALVSIAVLGAWGISYSSNRALIASTERSLGQYRVMAEPQLKASEVGDVDLASVLGPLQLLRAMDVGYANRGAATPVSERMGLAQRPRLVSAAGVSYREGLERMLRSRLILRLEQQIEAVMDDPVALYEALKVYLMLGGKAPRVDRDLVGAWMEQDWSANLYPGASNAPIRRDLTDHLAAMLDLAAGQRPTFDLNGPLVEKAQRTLARMNVADRAYALITASARSAPLEDWIVAARGGPDTDDVFETIDGKPLAELSVPGLYTYAGFNDFFLDQLGAVADRLVGDQWVMGEVGRQEAVEQQFAGLGPDLLERYRRDFEARWQEVLGKLRFRALSADKPRYLSLSALAAPTSPLRQLLISVRDETALTAEHDAAGGAAGGAGGGAADASMREAGNAILATAAQRLRDRADAFSRIGIDLALKKSQARAGAAFAADTASRIPGANIEAAFKPWHMLVDGKAGERPIDALIQNFYEIHRNLVIAASAPSQAQQAEAAMQTQIGYLRTNLSRLPPPLAAMVQTAIQDFEGDVTQTSIAKLNQMLNAGVTQACQKIAANRYPFDRGSDRDVALSDFAKLFAPDGILDRFFAQNLASLAEVNATGWTWKADSPVGQGMSITTLREFQRAAEIRDAFFSAGGSMPSVQMTIEPKSLSGDAEFGLLEVNGTLITSRQVGNVPATLAWPGSATGGAANVSVQPELPGRQTSISRSGPWALLRLLDAGNVAPTTNGLNVRFVVGGRELSYGIELATAANPLAGTALSSFRCPGGL